MIKLFLLFFVLAYLLQISNAAISNGVFMCNNGIPTCSAGQFIKVDYQPGGRGYGARHQCSCTNCPVGTYCTGGCALKYSVGTNICNHGYYCSAWGQNAGCSLCAHNYYQDVSGQSSCKLCPNGKFTLQTASSSESSCFCPTNTHLMINGHCTACASGVSYKQNNIHACKCSTGYYWSSTSCAACPAGQYGSFINNRELCDSCPLGKSSPAGSSSAVSCTDCSAGKYSMYSQQLCTNCVAGKYSSAGSTGCQNCAVGKYSRVGFANCLPCPKNTYTANTGTANGCTHCELGKFQPNEGGSACQMCPIAGTVYDEVLQVCEPCPAGTFLSVSEAGIKCQSCNPGSVAAKSSSECVACGAGKYSQSHYAFKLTLNPQLKCSAGETCTVQCSSDQWSDVDGVYIFDGIQTTASASGNKQAVRYKHVSNNFYLTKNFESSDQTEYIVQYKHGEYVRTEAKLHMSSALELQRIDDATKPYHEVFYEAYEFTPAMLCVDSVGGNVVTRVELACGTTSSFQLYEISSATISFDFVLGEDIGCFASRSTGEQSCVILMDKFNRLVFSAKINEFETEAIKTLLTTHLPVFQDIMSSGSEREAALFGCTESTQNLVRIKSIGESCTATPIDWITTESANVAAVRCITGQWSFMTGQSSCSQCSGGTKNYAQFLSTAKLDDLNTRYAAAETTQISEISESESSVENYVFVPYNTLDSFAATYVHQSAQNTRPFVSTIKLEFDMDEFANSLTTLAGACVDKVGLKSGTAWTGTTTLETCAVFDADPRLCDTHGYEDFGEGTASKHCCVCRLNDFCVDNPGKMSNRRFFDWNHKPCWNQFVYNKDPAGPKVSQYNYCDYAERNGQGTSRENCCICGGGTRQDEDLCDSASLQKYNGIYEFFEIMNNQPAYKLKKEIAANDNTYNEVVLFMCKKYNVYVLGSLNVAYDAEKKLLPDACDYAAVRPELANTDAGTQKNFDSDYETTTWSFHCTDASSEESTKREIELETTTVAVKLDASYTVCSTCEDCGADETLVPGTCLPTTHDDGTCVACAEGHFLIGGNCTQCPLGTYHSMDTFILNPFTCTPCPAFTHFDPSTDQASRSTTTFTRSESENDCICRTRAANNEDGFESATILNSKQEPMCVCGRGYTINRIQGTCTIVPANFYQDANDASVAKACPKNSISDPGSQDITDCRCQNGLELVDTECVCPVGKWLKVASNTDEDDKCYSCRVCEEFGNTPDDIIEACREGEENTADTASIQPLHEHYLHGCLNQSRGECRPCSELPACAADEVRVGCFGLSTGTCQKKAWVVTTPNCPISAVTQQCTKNAAKTQFGLGDFGFQQVFGVDEYNTDFACSRTCDGTRNQNTIMCSGPYACNVKSCIENMNVGESILNTLVCPVIMFDSDLSDASLVERKRGQTCQTCKQCGDTSTGLTGFSDWGAGCARECSQMLCTKNEIWDWTMKSCVLCSALKDVRLCENSEEFQQQSVTGNLPILYFTECQGTGTFLENIKYGSCLQCLDNDCKADEYPAGCQSIASSVNVQGSVTKVQATCKACKRAYQQYSSVQILLWHDLKKQMLSKLFCQLSPCDSVQIANNRVQSVTGVEYDGKICTKTCAEIQCKQKDVLKLCRLPHDSRCVSIPPVQYLPEIFDVMQTDFVPTAVYHGSEISLLNEAKTTLPSDYASFENILIPLKNDATWEYQCVYNAEAIEDSVHTPAGTSFRFWPPFLAYQVDYPRGTKICRMWTDNYRQLYSENVQESMNNQMKFELLPLQNTVTVDSFRHVLVDTEAYVVSYRFDNDYDAVNDNDFLQSMLATRGEQARSVGPFQGKFVAELYVQNNKKIPENKKLSRLRNLGGLHAFYLLVILRQQTASVQVSIPSDRGLEKASWLSGLLLSFSCIDLRRTTMLAASDDQVSEKILLNIKVAEKDVSILDISGINNTDIRNEQTKSSPLNKRHQRTEIDTKMFTHFGARLFASAQVSQKLVKNTDVVYDCFQHLHKNLHTLLNEDSYTAFTVNENSEQMLIPLVINLKQNSLRSKWERILHLFDIFVLPFYNAKTNVNGGEDLQKMQNSDEYVFSNMIVNKLSAVSAKLVASELSQQFALKQMLPYMVPNVHISDDKLVYTRSLGYSFNRFTVDLSVNLESQNLANSKAKFNQAHQVGGFGLCQFVISNTSHVWCCGPADTALIFNTSSNLQEIRVVLSLNTIFDEDQNEDQSSSTSLPPANKLIMYAIADTFDAYSDVNVYVHVSAGQAIRVQHNAISSNFEFSNWVSACSVLGMNNYVFVLLQSMQIATYKLHTGRASGSQSQFDFAHFNLLEYNTRNINISPFAPSEYLLMRNCRIVGGSMSLLAACMRTDESIQAQKMLHVCVLPLSKQKLSAESGDSNPTQFRPILSFALCSNITVQTYESRENIDFSKPMFISAAELSSKKNYFYQWIVACDGINFIFKANIANNKVYLTPSFDSMFVKSNFLRVNNMHYHFELNQLYLKASYVFDSWQRVDIGNSRHHVSEHILLDNFTAAVFVARKSSRLDYDSDFESDMSQFVMNTEMADFVFNRHALKNDNEISALRLFTEDSKMGSYVTRSDNILNYVARFDDASNNAVLKSIGLPESFGQQYVDSGETCISTQQTFLSRPSFLGSGLENAVAIVFSHALQQFQDETIPYLLLTFELGCAAFSQAPKYDGINIGTCSLQQSTDENGYSKNTFTVVSSEISFAREHYHVCRQQSRSQDPFYAFFDTTKVLIEVDVRYNKFTAFQQYTRTQKSTQICTNGVCDCIVLGPNARLVDASFHKSSLTETLAYSMLVQKPTANSFYVDSDWQHVYAIVPGRPDALGQTLLERTNEAVPTNLHKNTRIDVQISKASLVEEQYTDPAVGFDNFELLPLFSANPCTLAQDYSKLLVEIVLPSYANLLDVNLEHIVNNYDTSDDFDWPFFNAVVSFSSTAHAEHVKNKCNFNVNLILIEKLNEQLPHELHAKSILPMGCKIEYQDNSFPECSIQLPIIDNLDPQLGLGLQLTVAAKQDSSCILHESDEVFLMLKTYTSFYACDRSSFLEFSSGEYRCTLCRETKEQYEEEARTCGAGRKYSSCAVLNRFFESRQEDCVECTGIAATLVGLGHAYWQENTKPCEITCAENFYRSGETCLSCLPAIDCPAGFYWQPCLNGQNSGCVSCPVLSLRKIVDNAEVNTIVGDFSENEFFVTEQQPGDVVMYPGVKEFGGDPYNSSIASYRSLILSMQSSHPTAQLACISRCKNNAYRSSDSRCRICDPEDFVIAKQIESLNADANVFYGIIPCKLTHNTQAVECNSDNKSQAIEHGSASLHGKCPLSCNDGHRPSAFIEDKIMNCVACNSVLIVNAENYIDTGEIEILNSSSASKFYNWNKNCSVTCHDPYVSIKHRLQKFQDEDENLPDILTNTSMYSEVCIRCDEKKCKVGEFSTGLLCTCSRCTFS